MTKTELFKKAHTKARQIVGQVGNYMVAFKLALKWAWEEVKMSTRSALDILVDDFGGKEWQSGGHYRIYFNDWAEHAGCEVRRYKTGNLSTVKVGGEEISNCKAKKMLTGKFWYDMKSGKFQASGFADDTLVRVAAQRMKAAISA